MFMNIMVFKSLSSVQISIALAAVKFFDIDVREKVAFEFIRPGELAHTSQIIAVRTLKSLS